MFDAVVMLLPVQTNSDRLNERREKHLDQSSTMGYTHIDGLTSIYPTKKVRLPLQYDVSESIKARSCEDTFLIGSTVEHTGKVESFITSVHFRLHSNRKRLIFFPLVQQTTNFHFHVQQIEVELPKRVFSDMTLHVHERFEGDEKDPFVGIDLIDEQYLFISVKIRLSDFIIEEDRSCLSLDNFDDWVHISVPYSFELRAEPFKVQALTENDVIVSLEDGALLHFKRPSFLQNFEIFNFTRPNANRRALMGDLFRKKEKFTGLLGADAVSNIATVDRLRFLTLSSDKALTLYDCQLHSSIDQNKMFETSILSNEVTQLPKNCLKVLNTGATWLLFMLDPTLSKRDGCPSVTIHAFELKNASKIITEEKFSFDVEIPSYSSNQLHSNEVFHIHDYSVLQSGEYIKHQILWRYNNLNMYTTYLQDVSTGNVLANPTHNADTDVDTTLSKFETHDMSKIREMIWNSGRYDANLLTKANEVLFKSLGVEFSPTCDTVSKSNLDNMVDSISSSTGVTLSSIWYKLYLICEEFRRSGQKPLCLHQTKVSTFIIEANGVGVLRELHFFEDFSGHPASTALKGILKIVRARISSSALNQLQLFFETASEFTERQIGEKAQDLLEGRFKEHELGMLFENLNEETFELIEKLVSKPSKSDIEGCFNSDVKLDDFTRMYAIKTFLSIINAHREILLEIGSIFLLCEANLKVISSLNAIRRAMFLYKFLEFSFGISFKQSDKKQVQTDSIGRSGLALFWDCFREEKLVFHHISEYLLNDAFDAVRYVLVSNSFEHLIITLIIRLINCGEWDLAKTKFVAFLDTDNVVQKFVYGLVCLFTDDLVTFHDIVGDFENFRLFCESKTFVKARPLLQELSFLKCVLLDEAFDSEIKVNQAALYNHKLSEMCENYSVALSNSYEKRQEIIRLGVRFEEKAVNLLDDSPQFDYLRLDFQKKLFYLSIQMHEFKGAIRALESLLQRMSAFEQRCTVLALLRALIDNDKQDLLFEALCGLFCESHRSVVDKLLLEEANEDLVLWRALKSYELLYSWRLGVLTRTDSTACGDKRGASEALYIFITRFRMEKDVLKDASRANDDYRKFKLKVLELYMIIINCLQSFDDSSEMWIKKNNGFQFEIMRIEALLLEHSDWLRELENDIPLDC